ncbi:glycosyltransferase family 4 protein [Paraliobacillus sediminis]|uniref:glycosyltransferase family 4 protein n=1 Tax=Paraliobacillus sediminis TaxID=1885916 RepID=UPI000E3D83A5|nr:glycosyltransferase family 1 protein [Paraliobacillus sediminis]
MRIAIFTDTFFPDVNGVATTLANYITYLDQSEHEYHIFKPSTDHDQPLYTHPLLSMRFFLYPEYQIHLPNYAQIKQSLKAFKPDIIHVVTPFSIGLYGIRYALKNQIPLVGSYHTNFDQYLNYYHLRFLSQALWKYLHRVHEPMERIFVPSTDTLQQLKRKGFTNLRLWQRGVDTNTFRPSAHNKTFRKNYNITTPFTLSYVGRLSPEKNIDALMQIINSLQYSFSNKIHWLIVGDGPERQRLMELNNPNITFTGYLHGQDLTDIYANSDLFVFPSATETFGNVVLESLASGTPVIGSNTGGVKYLLENQPHAHGITCDPNKPDQFVKAITDLLTNPLKRHQMGNSARIFAKSKSWQKIFDQLLDDYTDVLQDRDDQTKQA